MEDDELIKDLQHMVDVLDPDPPVIWIGTIDASKITADSIWLPNNEVIQWKKAA